MTRHKEKDRILHFYMASIVLFLILAVVGVIFAGRAGLLSRGSSSPSSSNKHVEMTFVDLPRMTVSLGKGVGKQVQIDITLEVARGDKSVLEGYEPQILDALNVFFPKVRIEEIGKPRAMFLLRKDMLWRINNIGIPVHVQDLVIQNLVIL